MKKKRILSPSSSHQPAKPPPEQVIIRNILLSPGTHLLLLILAGAAIYANTFSVPFVLDDVTSIYGNPAIRDFRLVFKPRMVGDLSFALNYRWNGLDVTYYHLFNLLIHLGNGVLVYWLVCFFLKTSILKNGPAVSRYSRVLPLFTALLFICHPIQTQAVTYISQRVAALATFFYLGTHVAWLAARLTTVRKNKIAFNIVAVSTALLAMTTKEIAFTLPLTLLLVEFVFFDGSFRRKSLPLALFSLTSLMVPVSMLAASGATGSLTEQFWRLLTPTTIISRGDYLLTQFRVQITYLRLLLFPTGQNLDYDYPVYHSFASVPVAVSFLLVVIMIFGALYLLVRGRRGDLPDLRLIAFGILWFFITLSIESSLIPLQDVIFEHRLYLPSFGFFVVIVTALLSAGRSLENRQLPGYAVTVSSLSIVVFLLALTSAARNEVWKDEISLWEDVVSKSPGKVRARGSLGTAYQNAGLYDAAAREYEAAIRLNPRDAANYNNLGTIYHHLKKWDDAARVYRDALRLEPGNIKAHYNLGMVLTEQGDFREAEHELHEATRLKPDYDQAHNSLGIVYAKMARNADALEEFGKAARLNPANVEAVKNYQALDTALKGLSIRR